MRYRSRKMRNEGKLRSSAISCGHVINNLLIGSDEPTLMYFDVCATVSDTPRKPINMYFAIGDYFPGFGGILSACPYSLPLQE